LSHTPPLHSHYTLQRADICSSQTCSYPCPMEDLIGLQGFWGSNGISVGSSGFAQFTRVSNAQTTILATCVGKGRISALRADDASFAAPDAPNVGEASFSTRHGAPQPLTPSPAYGPHLEKNPVGAPVCAMSHASAAGATARRCVYIYARLALASMSPIITRRIPACLRHTSTAATVIRN